MRHRFTISLGLAAALWGALWAGAAQGRPTLAVMAGFIKDPQGPLTLMVWRHRLGSQFDAARWAQDLKQAGASTLIFYDKWHDGLVLHDTKTTRYKTRRDFVREMADACHKAGLRLVVYYNPHVDGNPQFSRWALRTPQRRLILMSERWPFECHSLHTPFRRIAVEQVREVLTQYGRIDGLWLDIFDQRLDTANTHVAAAFGKMFGAPYAQADAVRRDEFRVRTLAGYLDDVRAIAKTHQPELAITANGSADGFAGGGRWAKWVGARLDYATAEGHGFARIDGLARLAPLVAKPLEIGTLLSRTWFTPNEDAPPPARTTPKQAIAEVAAAVCRGASVYMALTPGHAGVFGDDLKAAKAVGAWFNKVEPVLAGAKPVADAAVVLGAPAPDGPGLPRSNAMWNRSQAARAGALDEAGAICDGLERHGLLTRYLCAQEKGGFWPESLGGFRVVVVPDLAVLDDARAERLRRYVRDGGCLVAFGHASLLDGKAARRADYALAEALGARYRSDVAAGPTMWRVSVQTDSVFAGQYGGPNVLDDEPTFWASADKPMPHWAQIDMPEPIDVAKVEVVSRQGGFHVVDVDIEVPDGKKWKVVQSVRNAPGKTISAALDPPVRTAKVRVKILRELVGKKNRQIADVEAIRIFDKAGRNRAAEHELRIPVTLETPEAKTAFGAEPFSFAPMAAQVEAAGAEVLARLGTEGRPPAILRNRVGKGQAILVVTTGAAFRDDARFWTGLSRLIGARPTVQCGDTGRYRFILNRLADGHVLHTIDRQVGRPGVQPAGVTVSLEAGRIGAPTRATLVGDSQPVELKRANGLITFTVRPDPVASVILR